MIWEELEGQINWINNTWVSIKPEWTPSWSDLCWSIWILSRHSTYLEEQDVLQETQSQRPTFRSREAFRRPLTSKQFWEEGLCSTIIIKQFCGIGNCHKFLWIFQSSSFADKWIAPNSLWPQAFLQQVFIRMPHFVWAGFQNGICL